VRGGVSPVRAVFILPERLGGLSGAQLTSPVTSVSGLVSGHWSRQPLIVGSYYDLVYNKEKNICIGGSK